MLLGQEEEEKSIRAGRISAGPASCAPRHRLLAAAGGSGGGGLGRRRRSRIRTGRNGGCWLLVTVVGRPATYPLIFLRPSSCGPQGVGHYMWELKGSICTSFRFPSLPPDVHSATAAANCHSPHASPTASLAAGRTVASVTTLVPSEQGRGQKRCRGRRNGSSGGAVA